MTKEQLSELTLICGCQRDLLVNPPTPTSKTRLIELNERMEKILMGQYEQKIKQETQY